MLELIRSKGLKVGDRVLVREGKIELVGVLMPRSKLEDDEHIVVKLSDGYNVGVSIGSIELQRAPDTEPPHPQPEAPLPPPNPALPQVAIISTGGTIASRVDYRTGAVSPALSAADLYQAVPELGELANIRTEILFSILSENMSPKHWSSIAEAVYRQIKAGAQGVVVTHGTDTMGYTAAALSFALRNLPVPVILVGSQRSSDRPSSDAALNLKGAVSAAAYAPFAEVGVLMHATPSDDLLVIHRGTRARKLHTSRRDAFRSVNSKPLAFVKEGKIEVGAGADSGVGGGYRPRGAQGDLELKPHFEEDVVLIKSFPGMPPDIFDPIIHRGFRGIVLEGTGLGHVPDKVFHQVRRAVDSGLTVVMASQCINGRVNMNVYSTGRELLGMGVIPAGDMLPETALVKLMWVLGQTEDREKIRELFTTNLAGELSERSEYEGGVADGD
ncbi:MAG: Glu-tRNA(Gln) amidotransferase subunit GatD [Nitrososphaeria archaeon]|nr:Glu-tRNA(Gln) amidotransferase subunit GatD [Nitrososphaeria archaeon]